MVVKYEPYEKTPHYSEAVTTQVSFVLLTPSYKGLHAPVQCRDFIQDAFWSEFTKSEIKDQYGFTWTPGTLDPQDSYYRMLLKFRDGDMALRVKRIRMLLNLWERRLNWDNTLVRATTDKTAKVLVVTRQWMEQPIRVSLLTFLCRVGMVYSSGETMEDFFQAVDKGRKLLNDGDEGLCVNPARERVLTIWKEKQFPAQKYADYTSCQYVHSYSGIRSFSEASPHGPLYAAIDGCLCTWCEEKREKEAAKARLRASAAAGLRVSYPEA